MIRRRLDLIIIFAAFLLQPFISALFPVWFVPNLIFCILIIMAATFDPEDMVPPLILVFVLTIIQDFYYSQFVGVNIIAMVLTVIIVMWLRRMANIENPLFVALIVVIANLAYASIYWIIYALLSSPYSYLYMLTRLPRTAIPNMVVMFIALFLISRDIIQKRRDGYFR